MRRKTLSRGEDDDDDDDDIIDDDIEEEMPSGSDASAGAGPLSMAALFVEDELRMRPMIA